MTFIIITPVPAVVLWVAETTADTGKRRTVFGITCRGIPP